MTILIIIILAKTMTHIIFYWKRTMTPHFMLKKDYDTHLYRKKGLVKMKMNEPRRQTLRRQISG